MCGIAGFASDKPVENFLVEALKRLEYRGYDSYGYLTSKDGNWAIHKEVGGTIGQHQQQGMEGNIGIGHTRWATHGSPSLLNTHPILCGRRRTENRFYKHLTDYRGGTSFVVSDPNIAIVHNGVVDNYEQIKDRLFHYYNFDTQTDTEAIGNCIDWLLHNNLRSTYETADVVNCLQPLFNNVNGSFAILFVTKYLPNSIIGMCRGMPLLWTNKGYVASDINVFSGYDDIAYRMDDGDIIVLSPNNKFVGGIKTKTTPYNEKVPPKASHLLLDYPHYMLKEIDEQKELVSQTLKPVKMERPSKIFAFGCGSSWHAALIGKHYFEDIANIPTEVEYSSETVYRSLSVQPRDSLFIGLTQSGETKDTLDVIRKLTPGIRNTMVIHNSPNSQAVKISDYDMDIQAGLEIGVAATKTFTQQVLALYQQAIAFALPVQNVHNYLAIENQNLRQAIISILNKKEEIKSLAKDITRFNHALYLGRGINYPVALEGALKMKEVARLHAEAMPASELKHGPLALIDNNTLSIFLCAHKTGHDVSAIAHNMSEVKSRGGLILSISDSASWGWANKYTDYSLLIPNSTEFLQPILFNIPLQLLAYYVSIERGFNPDKPRNLAKSVSV